MEQHPRTGTLTMAPPWPQRAPEKDAIQSQLYRELLTPTASRWGVGGARCCSVWKGGGQGCAQSQSLEAGWGRGDREMALAWDPYWSLGSSKKNLESLSKWGMCPPRA